MAGKWWQLLTLMDKEMIDNKIWTEKRGPDWLNLPLWNVSKYWRETKDGDRSCRRLLENHYSYNPRINSFGDVPKLFVGPGEKLVLRDYDPFFDCKAVFVWRKFIDDSGQAGVNCAVFRNESDNRSSDMILDAEHWARDRWGNIRAYTYVAADKVQSRNPGYCYKAAGWKYAGITQGGLLILEKSL